MIQTRHLYALATCCSALLAACASPGKNPAWDSPVHELRLHHYAGDPLAGPQPELQSPPTQPLDALAVRIETYFLQQLPGSGLRSLAREAALQSTDGRDPIRIVDRRGASIRVGFGSEVAEFCEALGAGSAGEVRSLELFETVLPEGVTVALELATPSDACATELVRTASAIRAAVVTAVADLAPDRRAVSVLRTAPSPEGEPMAVLMPIGETGHAFLALFFLDAAPGDPQEQDAHRERFAACMEQVRAVSNSALADLEPLDENALDVRRIAGAVDALEVVQNYRPALVYLSAQAGANAAHDVAWLASDDFLEACVQRVLPDMQAVGSRWGQSQAAWHLERACYRELGERHSNGTLPPELVSVLFRHAGELGEFPSLLNDALTESKGQEEFDARLIGENMLFLEDRSPAARVRAFDWLTQRGVAPAGFDPLAGRDERRAALAPKETDQ